MEPIGICLMTETFYPVTGGGETQARALAEGLAARGHRTTLITRRSDSTFKRAERMGPLQLYRVPPAGGGQLKKWGLAATAFPALYRLRDEYDLILVSGYRVMGLPAVLAARALGKRCILKADSLGEMSGEFFAGGLARLGLSTTAPPVRLALRLRNNILRRADGFVAISPTVARELVGQAVKGDAIHAIPNGVDMERFKPLSGAARAACRARLGLASDEIVVLYTGRLVTYKGLPLLLAVWREIQQRFPQAKLLLVGEGGLDMHRCEGALRRYVDTHGLGRSVRFTGLVDDVPAYLQAADIFVFPTENEAFGISLVEAMACSLPAISTTAGGVNDILQHRRNGLQIEPGNGAQLYRALEALIEGPALRAYLGERARKRAVARYAIGAVVTQYETLFEQVLSDRSVSRRPVGDLPRHER